MLSDDAGNAFNAGEDAVLTAGNVGDLMILATVAGVPAPAQFPQTVTAPVPMVDFISGDVQIAGTRLPFAEPVTVSVVDQT